MNRNRHSQAIVRPNGTEVGGILSGVSTFAGIGGFDLGFEHAGIKTVAQVEKDKNCLNVLRRHWPDTPKITDVNHADRTNIPFHHVLAGGFPCQGASVAGQGGGLADDRTGLWFQLHRIAMECLPGVVVIENVPGLFSVSERQDFALVLGGLLGFPVGVPEQWRSGGIAKGRIYHVAWRVLDSRFFGVAQRRRRGVPSDALPFVTPAVTSKWKKGSGGPAGDECQNIIAPDVSHTLTSGSDGTQDGTGRGYPLIGTPKVFHRNADCCVTEQPDITAALRANAEHSNQFLMDRTGVRRLTPTECERLQGFEDGWTAEGVTEKGKVIKIKDAPRYHMLGNAVTTTVANWIGRRIVAIAGAKLLKWKP